MTKFSLENRKMVEFSRGKPASVGSVSVHRLNQARGLAMACAVYWSTWGHRDAWACTRWLSWGRVGAPTCADSIMNAPACMG
jgi:hypothetical protein